MIVEAVLSPFFLVSQERSFVRNIIIKQLALVIKMFHCQHRFFTSQQKRITVFWKLIEYKTHFYTHILGRFRSFQLRIKYTHYLPSPFEKSGVICLDSRELYPRSLISIGGMKTPTGHRDSAFSGLIWTGIMLLLRIRCPMKTHRSLTINYFTLLRSNWYTVPNSREFPVVLLVVLLLPIEMYDLWSIVRSPGEMWINFTSRYSKIFFNDTLCDCICRLTICRNTVLINVRRWNKFHVYLRKGQGSSYCNRG